METVLFYIESKTSDTFNTLYIHINLCECKVQVSRDKLEPLSQSGTLWDELKHMSVLVACGLGGVGIWRSSGFPSSSETHIWPKNYINCKRIKEMLEEF